MEGGSLDPEVAKCWRKSTDVTLQSRTSAALSRPTSLYSREQQRCRTHKLREPELVTQRGEKIMSSWNSCSYLTQLSGRAVSQLGERYRMPPRLGKYDVATPWNQARLSSRGAD